MKRRSLLVSVGALAVSGCLTSQENETGTKTPTAPDSIDADWPGPPYNTGKTNYAPTRSGLTEKPAKLWTTELQTSLSGPVLRDETLFVGGDDGVVRAVDAISGNVQWDQTVDSPAGTPWAMDGRLVVPTADGVVCLDIDDGTQTWREETPERVDLLATSDGVYYLTEEPAVHAILAADGNEQWHTSIGEPWESHLFTDGNTLFVSTGTKSNRPWKLRTSDGSLLDGEPDSGYDFPAERFYLDGTIYAVDPFFGIVHGDEWTQGVDAVGSFAFSGGNEHVYFIGAQGDKPGLKALSRTDGTISWSTDAVQSITHRPVVTDNCVLLAGDGSVHCFDAGDGTERWSIGRENGGKQFIVADDILFTTHEKVLRAFRPP